MFNRAAALTRSAADITRYAFIASYAPERSFIFDAAALRAMLSVCRPDLRHYLMSAAIDIILPSAMPPRPVFRLYAFDNHVPPSVPAARYKRVRQVLSGCRRPLLRFSVIFHYLFSLRFLSPLADFLSLSFRFLFLSRHFRFRFHFI